MVKKLGFVFILALLLASGITGAALAANTPVSGAVFTTVNPDVDGVGHCLNGAPGAQAGLVNCNIYDGKEYVWLSGGPEGNQPALADGTYFFAVLSPGGQGGNENPNDGTENNLSDLFPTSNTGAGDEWTNRVFSVSNGYISYSGTHDFDNAYQQSQYGKIRLFPYDDTTNPGGVYILAVCNLADADPTAPFQPGVDPSDCKYDAFKVMQEEQALDLIVSKTAFPTYDLTYSWTINKSVDKTLVKQVGGTVDFNYTVEVSHDAGTASNWKVAGQITVENPNAYDVSAVTVTDEVSNNGICTVTDGLDITVPGYGSVVLEYECTYATSPEPPYGINTATATWFEGDYKHVSGTASFDFADAIPNLIDECVDVSDSYAGFLGTVCVGGSNPTSFTYTRTVTVPQWDCVDYDNTATFVAVDTGATGTASQSVTVCGPMKTGALTIGFWQNPNGQKIIKAYCSGTSGTSLFTFLTGYNPFKDLAGSSCASVASYVTSVIKAASSAGDSMNPMLKAQMLATALNVYFSDPTLGGNRIGARAPIGSVSVDLTMICTDMTCTSYQDVSSVFGGSPKTISEMLSYAASMSNIGGTLWYGNVKSTQELAKDAFDAINNQKVFAP
ncbi:MAG: hypothetical protein MUC85_06715 [Anaerolineales bacterium]|nr:hypothetical protein [Anaerolineales bacterium]